MLWKQMKSTDFPNCYWRWDCNVAWPRVHTMWAIFIFCLTLFSQLWITTFHPKLITATKNHRPQAHSTSDPLLVHFRFTSGSLGPHRRSYEVSHNLIFQKNWSSQNLRTNIHKDGHTEKKWLLKIPFAYTLGI